MSPVSVKGLKALCALGLSGGDEQLATAVTQELLAHIETDEQHLTDCAVFLAHLAALQVCIRKREWQT